MIKFYSINKSDKKIKKKILKSLNRIIEKNSFIMGGEVIKFENKFKKLCKSKYALSCSNGTDAITLALLSLNIEKNSEVIIPAMTYASTFYAVLNAGMKPILVDINANDPLINFEEVKKKINKKTKVIIPVHLYGSVVNIEKLISIIKNKKIYIIDDCSQAHGAMYFNKKMVGGENITNISTFSLYPGKNLGAYGDAGIITTNNAKYSERIKKMRNIGALKKFKHETIGFNNRLDTFQASVLNHKIDRLNFLNKRRKLIAKKYFKLIKNKNISFLDYSNYAVFHQFVISVHNRQKLINYLNYKKIEYGLHYPHSINQMEYYKKKFKKEKFKNAEKLARTCISLPIDPMLKENEVTYIINSLNNFK